MKKLLLGLMLGAALFLVGCKEEKAAPQEPKIAVLNLGVVFQTSKASVAAAEYMSKMESELQGELEKSSQGLSKDADGNVTKEDMPKFQKLFGDLQQRYNAEQQMVLTRLNAMAMETVDEYRKQHGPEVIIRADQAFSFDPAVDITEKIVKLMDAKQISFEPMLPETPQGDAAGNATAPAGNATAPAPEGNATAPAPADNATAPASSN